MPLMIYETPSREPGPTPIGARTRRASAGTWTGGRYPPWRARTPAAAAAADDARDAGRRVNHSWNERNNQRVLGSAPSPSSSSS